jgi:hypothetical protein
VAPIYFRLVAYADDRRGGRRDTFADVDWKKAPALSVSVLPVQPTRSPVGAFLGRSALDRADFISKALPQVRRDGVLSGRDRDLRYALVDLRQVDMTVVEAHELGLTDTVELMPDKPDAVVNGQFIASAVGIGTEGQVVREAALINSNSQPARVYVTQDPGSTTAAGIRFGTGNPRAARPAARVAFGGLGPVLLAKAPVAPLTPWAKSIHDRPRSTGRGVIAIRRDLDLLLLLVQQDGATLNAMTMPEIRDLLVRLGFDDAAFNDGSDSESLFAAGGWLVAPAWVKDEAMDFAVGFVKRSRVRRARLLVLDGTKTADGKGFASGLRRPVITHYATRNLAPALAGQGALASIAGTFDGDVGAMWKATTPAQAGLIRTLIANAGAGGEWADLMYVSSHAWRHGELWFHPNDLVARGTLMVATPWGGFSPRWQTTPRWLVLAGCAVLGLRYTRGLSLTAVERAHLTGWHRDIHGASATVPGLNPARRVLYAAYHPGWAWLSRVFARSPALRGVLGYWYRSPSQDGESARQVDAEIAADFAESLRRGAPFLEAWEGANRRTFLSHGYLYRGRAPWAAMVRAGCETDSVAVLERRTAPAAQGSFRYYDEHQRGIDVRSAYAAANTRSEVAEIGAVRVRHHPFYDVKAIEELRAVPTAPTAANFLAYDDGVAP